VTTPPATTRCFLHLLYLSASDQGRGNSLPASVA
jgi:hypothetical protein